MASIIYNKGIQAVASAAISFAADTFYMMLVTSTYAPDKDADDFRNDVTNEVTGTGYTAGGQAVTCTLTLDTALDRINATFSAVTWTLATFTARAAVIYKHRGGASSADELVCYIDFGSNQSCAANDFIVTPSSPYRFQN